MNNKSITLPVILRAVLYFVVVLFSFLFVYKFIFSPLPESFFGIPNGEVFEQTPTVGDPAIGLILSYFLLGISILAILFFFIMQLVDNPKKTVGSLIGFALVAVIFLIAWGASSGDMTLGKVSEATSRFIGGTLGLTTILGIIALLAIVAGEIYSFFK
ncbi:hypothetical protein ACFLRI_03020 [Bacteroidota bacterium]